MTKNTIITFIGGGNMSTSLIGGLLETGFAVDNIRVSDVTAEPLAARFPVQCLTDNVQAVADANVVVLAVKPQMLAEVVKTLAPHLVEPYPLFISIAAGIRVEDIARWLGNKNVAIVRTMPNTPALVQSGATALFAGQYVTTEQHQLAESILRSVGLTLWVEQENALDAVTALSGSGPAYFFLVMEAMQQAGVQLGLTPETARLLTLQTAFGAAKMALESPEDAAILRAKVTSKGGTTERAIAVLQQGNLVELFGQALTAAQKRAEELAEQLGRDN